MHAQFRRQPWGFDANYQRVEALDDQGRPLGYVFFVRYPQPSQRPVRSALSGSWTIAACVRTFTLALSLIGEVGSAAR
jgi:hypothetical protein